MSDFDQTIVSGTGKGTPGGQPQAPQPSAQPPEKRNKLLIFGGVGCAVVLCLVLLAAAGVYYFLSGSEVLTGLTGGGETAVSATTEPVESATVAVEEPPVTEAVEQTEPGEEAISAGSETTEATQETMSEPEIGPITFAAGATDEFEPIDASDTFEEGITRIHALFDYRGMSKDYTWERVWYLDGEEVLRNAADWTDPEEGRFDYFLDAGGDPLPPGDWTLKIYVEGELLASGSFTIEPAIAAATATRVAQATPTPSPTPKATPTPKPSGGGVYKLVYTKWDGGQHNMYVADTNGNNERFLLHRAAGPSWTPDGQMIFFYGEEGIDRQRLDDGREFVFDGISNGIVALVNAASLPSIEEAKLFQGLDWKQGSARWANVSPDGQMVAFDAKPGGDYRIYFLGTEDNQQFRFEILGEQADWSPDSQQIVYRSGRDGKTGLWISNRDDTGHRLLTDNGSDSFPAWSPNGRVIAFSREVDGNVDIYLVNVDGSNVHRLTDAPGPDTLPVWTPSGDIIFRSARTGSWGIWKMSGNGANQQEIIPNAGVGPDWSMSRMDVR